MKKLDRDKYVRVTHPSSRPGVTVNFTKYGAVVAELMTNGKTAKCNFLHKLVGMLPPKELSTILGYRVSTLDGLRKHKKARALCKVYSQAHRAYRAFNYIDFLGTKAGRALQSLVNSRKTSYVTLRELKTQTGAQLSASLQMLHDAASKRPKGRYYDSSNYSLRESILRYAYSDYDFFECGDGESPADENRPQPTYELLEKSVVFCKSRRKYGLEIVKLNGKYVVVLRDLFSDSGLRYLMTPFLNEKLAWALYYGLARGTVNATEFHKLCGMRDDNPDHLFDVVMYDCNGYRCRMELRRHTLREIITAIRKAVAKPKATPKKRSKKR